MPGFPEAESLRESRGCREDKGLFPRIFPAGLQVLTAHDDLILFLGFAGGSIVFADLVTGLLPNDVERSNSLRPYNYCIGSSKLVPLLDCLDWVSIPSRHIRWDEKAVTAPNHQQALLIGDGCRRSIELRDADRERLVVGLGPVPQHAERNLLAQQDRPVG